MIAYVKSIKDFKTVFAAQVIEYDLPIATAGDDTGTIQLKAQVAPGNEGNWLLLDGRIWIIQQIRVDSGVSSLTLAAPINAFDRALPYTAPSESTEQFVASQLTANFKSVKDQNYAMPYLRISNPETTTDFSAPAVDESMLFTLPSYVQAVGTATYKEDGTVDIPGVGVDFEYTNTELIITIHSNTPANHKVVFETSDFQLKARSHDQSIISKITFYDGGEPAGNWYLTELGLVVLLPTASDPQIPGKWVATAIPDATKSARDQAAEIFAGNKNSHKIEFYGREKLSLHDTVTMRLDGAVETYKITCVRVSTADNRYLYICGDMAVTLTDKVRQIGAEASGNSAMPADYVVAQGVSGKWTYRKWASGIAECWGVFSAAGAVQTTTAWGSIYYGTWMDTDANKTGRKYPFAFVDEPTISATPIGVSGDFWLMTNASNNTGTLMTHAPAYSIARPDQWGATNPRISYYVVGKWK